MTRPRAPGHLAADGRRFWQSVTSVYELSPAELTILGRAAVTVDTLAAIDAEISEQGLSVKGSRGQVIPNRMIKVRCELERVLDVQIRTRAARDTCPRAARAAGRLPHHPREAGSARLL
jgi:hypothetical protein